MQPSRIISNDVDESQVAARGTSSSFGVAILTFARNKFLLLISRVFKEIVYKNGPVEVLFVETN
jgi:hypothetical protein